MAYREFSNSDRRSSYRFPIEREVRYKVVDGKNVLKTGAGKTVDLSRNGILFTTERPLGGNSRLELSVDWPVKLDNGCPLKLVALGRVVRVEHSQAAMSIEKYEFRTHKAGAFSIASTVKAPTQPQQGKDCSLPVLSS